MPPATFDTLATVRTLEVAGIIGLTVALVKLL